MAEQAVDWRGALEALTAVAAEVSGHLEAKDNDAAKAASVGVHRIDHLVLRLVNCPDMEPVYRSFGILGMVPAVGVEMRKICTRIRTMRAERSAAGTAPSCPDLDADPDDLPPGVVVPAGYSVGHGGVVDTTHEARVAHQPLLMTALYRDYDTGKARVRLSWVYDGRWEHRVVSRNTAADARALVALSEDFAPVNSTTATAAVRFLAAQEAASMLPVRKSTSRQGWHGCTFVLGYQGIGPASVELQLTKEDEKGPAMLARALSQSGTLDGWRDMVSTMADRPVSLLGLGAAAAAPLLGVIPGARSFVLDVFADTSSGKTSAARAWASMWGDWGATEIKWDGTKVGMERMGSFLRHLPFFVDDTKHANKDPQKVVEWIYDVSGARGKVRGTRHSFELGRKMDTIGIVTGERSATTLGDFAHGGASARVLSITGEFTTSATHAQRLERESREQYGTAGLAIVEYLLAEKQRDGWASIRQSYAALEADYVAKLTEKAEGETVRIANRAAPYLALIHLGLRTLSLVGAVDFTPAALKAAMGAGVVCAVEGVRAADVPRAMMRRLLQWAASQRRRFYTPPPMVRDKNERDPDPGSHGWAGRWDDDGLHVLPVAAERALKDFCDWPAVYEAWKREKLLEDFGKDGRQRFTKNRRVAPGFGNTTPKCFTISAAGMALTFDTEGTAEASD